jgi:hypothetical protein
MKSLNKNSDHEGRYFYLQFFRQSGHSLLAITQVYTIKNCLGGDDTRKFEPKVWLKFEDLDKSIQKLRAIYKVHPEWFEVPKPKSGKGQNAVDYSV